MSLGKAMAVAARLWGVSVLALAAGAAAAPGLAGASVVSANWAGYVAVPSASVGARFSSVSGSWTVPSATCATGRETHSAVWVGLGGDSESASALEQTGTDMDCSRAGRAAYSAWYELVPAGPVAVPLRLRPGDEMTASVTVRAHDVTLRLRDVSTGARFSVTRRPRSVDSSSAEWIVEAPSVCFAGDACATLSLTNFGSVTFFSATATAAGHTGTAADPDWAASALELRQGAERDFDDGRGRRFGLSSGLVTASPSPLSDPTGSFAVSWQEQSIQAQPPPAPIMPGFNGGNPS